MRNFILILLSSYAIVCSAQKIRIAVYVEGNIPENYKTLLGDNLVEGLLESNQYIAVNRSDVVYAILRKVRLRQESGHVDVSQIVSSTKELGEEQLFVVNITEIEKMLNFRAQIIEMKKNELLGTASTLLVKDSLSISSILSVTKKLLKHFISTSDSEGEIAIIKQQEQHAWKQRVIERAQNEYDSLRRYDITYATFKANPEKYAKKDSPTLYYLNKSEKVKRAGHWMWFLPAYTALGVGMGVGLADLNELNSFKAPMIIGSVIVMMFPTFSCYIASASYRKRAWKEYRQPYLDAKKNLKSTKKTYGTIELQVVPVVYYEYAGAQVKVTF